MASLVKRKLAFKALALNGKTPTSGSILIGRYLLERTLYLLALVSRMALYTTSSAGLEYIVGDYFGVGIGNWGS